MMNSRVRISLLRWGVFSALLLAVSGCARVYTPISVNSGKQPEWRGSGGYKPPTVTSRSTALAVQPRSNGVSEAVEARESPQLHPWPKSGKATVQPGDTLYNIALRHGVMLGELIVLNKQMRPFNLKPGQQLALPAPAVHMVEKGDTIYGVSRRYSVAMADLVKINSLSPPYVISLGQRIRIPRASRNPNNEPDGAGIVRASLPSSETTRAATRLPNGRAVVPLPVERPDRSVTASRNMEPPRRTGKGFLWPIRGPVLMGFGSRGTGLHNDGINIAARKGAAVKAAENGVVAYAGNELRGFGQLILLKHQGGWTTAYAHNSKLLVRTGQRVRRGQVISRVGRTGNVRRPQLHFEMRRGEEAVNPVKYLTVRTARSRRISRAFVQVGQRDPG